MFRNVAKEKLHMNHLLTTRCLKSFQFFVNEVFFLLSMKGKSFSINRKQWRHFTSIIDAWKPNHWWENAFFIFLVSFFCVCRRKWKEPITLNAENISTKSTINVKLNERGWNCIMWQHEIHLNSYTIFPFTDLLFFSFHRSTTFYCFFRW